MSEQTYLRGYEGQAHSTENQRILDKLVHREVLHRASELVQFIDFVRNNAPIGELIDEDSILSVLNPEQDYVAAATEAGAVFIKDIDGEWWCINPAGMTVDLFDEITPPPGYTVTADFEIIALHEDGAVHMDREVSNRRAVARAWTYWACDLPDEVSAIDSSKEDAARLFCDNNDIEPSHPEVYEHWIVTEFLAEHLAQRGEAVGEILDFHIWGRTTTGQSISLDPVIADIAAEMEILVGQRNSWEERPSPFPPNPEFHPAPMPASISSWPEDYDFGRVTRAYRKGPNMTVNGWLEVVEAHFIDDVCFDVGHDGKVTRWGSYHLESVDQYVRELSWVEVTPSHPDVIARATTPTAPTTRIVPAP